MSGWGGKAATTQTNPVESEKFGVDYYANRFNNVSRVTADVRMALVARENCAKTGLALSLCDKEISEGKKIAIIDIDNSARSTVDYVYPDATNIEVHTMQDEGDDSVFNDDNSINYVALVDKVNFFINYVANKLKQNPDEYAAVIFDGGSTFLKWCEHAMTYVLQNRSKNPVNPEDGDRFNQAEWRIRNKLYRDTMSRLHGLAIPKVFYTFHLKEIKEFVNDGTGKKVLMTVGERPEWEKGTMRLFSQQIFLTRYMKKADNAAGVKGDSKLNEGQWVVRAEIEEMKGKNMEHLGTTHTILSVDNGKVVWNGLPMLQW